MTLLNITEIVSIGVAIATLILAFFTYLSVQQARDAQRAQVRPVLIPAKIPSLKEIQGNQNTEIDIDIENVGSGVATDVWGAMIPYSDTLPGVPHQLSFRGNLPLRPGEKRSMSLMTGGTIFTSKDKVGKVPLTVPAEFAPEVGIPNPQDRRERVTVRLTLTCKDSLGLKQSFAYDFDLTGHCISINSSTIIQKDLRDLDVEKGNGSVPRRKSSTADHSC